VTSAVIFDLDDTLIIEEVVARASARQVGAMVPEVDSEVFGKALLATANSRWLAGPEHGVCTALGFASWEGLWSNFEGNAPLVDGLRDWSGAYREDVWRTVLTSFGIDDPARERALADAYVEFQHAGHPLIVGADALVRSLAAHRGLGLLTNGPSDIQRLKLEQTGLSECFGAVAISGELGVGKPDPAVFFEVLSQLGASPGDSLMVGDSWERDILGAIGAGLPAVWISAGRTPPETLPGVRVVEGVNEMIGMLD
jgi:putative hydrolase of the HAD superfamily